jgi:hypothetical protein
MSYYTTESKKRDVIPDMSSDYFMSGVPGVQLPLVIEYIVFEYLMNDELAIHLLRHTDDTSIYYRLQRPFARKLPDTTPKTCV